MEALAIPEQTEGLAIFEAKAITHENKRMMICKHPLEWDKELYPQEELKKFAPLASGGQRFEAFSKLVETLDIWSGVKGKAGLPEENSLYYAHPIFFINRLQLAGLLNRYIKVSDNIKGLANITSFYNAIADIARNEYAQDGEDTKCNLFVHKILKDYFHDDIYKKVFPNRTSMLANELYNHFEANDKIFENINNQGIETIQEMADNGDLILMSYTHKPHGHIAFVGHRGLTISTVTKEKSNNRDVAMATNMKNHDYWPIVVQAGVHTGITSMFLAADDWLKEGERSNLLNNKIVCFYKIRR
jgi:hypothetical protein